MKAHAARRVNDHVAHEGIAPGLMARDRVAHNLIHRIQRSL
jgi:hypothetical protein